ncbi:MAG: tyrR [Firmicutes bacterium]|nr:tyrR [Bacillota bacterium]
MLPNYLRITTTHKKVIAIRLKIPNVDRVGLVLDISSLLAEEHINILSMEVELKTVYLETEELTPTTTDKLIRQLLLIPGILDIIEIDLMPHQEKAEQLNAVLASVSDGIIAIDTESIVTQYNLAAEKILHLPAQAVLGRKLTDVLSDDMYLLNALRHNTVYNNHEVILEEIHSHCLASGRPIIDPSGRTIGAVAILKDISDVRELVYTVTGQMPLTFAEISFTSTAMQQIIALAKTYARSDSTVLIRGETGTGKELFARALHAASPRNRKIFVPINCAAIPDTLLESELFGYEEGAFTGAAKGGKQGLFELANEGTLFLDEIGEISAHLQAKLLRVLQEKKIRRIGSSREISINARILAATNRNLEDMIDKGSFREDLYYRLNVIPLFIPPLRERCEDIAILAQVFLQRFAVKLQKKVQTISDTALDKLRHYSWPGNIRELENVIERAINIVDGPIILAEQILLQQDHSRTPLITGQTKRSLREIIDQTEREVLTAALRTHRTSRQLGNALGLSHTAVLKKLHKHKLDLLE